MQFKPRGSPVSWSGVLTPTSPPSAELLPEPRGASALLPNSLPALLTPRLVAPCPGLLHTNKGSFFLAAKKPFLTCYIPLYEVASPRLLWLHVPKEGAYCVFLYPFLVRSCKVRCRFNKHFLFVPVLFYHVPGSRYEGCDSYQTRREGLPSFGLKSHLC